MLKEYTEHFLEIQLITVIAQMDYFISIDVEKAFYRIHCLFLINVVFMFNKEILQWPKHKGLFFSFRRRPLIV